MDAITKTIEGRMKIYVLGDLHIGSPYSKYQEIKFEKDAYYFFIGDLLDNAIIDSVSDTYKQTADPQTLFEELESFLAPIKDRILGMVSGNHERRTLKKVGIDLLKMIAKQYNIPYDPNLLIVDLNYTVPTGGRGSKNRFNCVFALAHGYTSARTIGGKITGNARFLEVVSNADVYITGHTHQPSVVKTTIFEYDRRNKKLSRRDRFFVTVPAWLDYEDYAQQKLFSPSSFGYIEVILDGKGKEQILEIKIR